MRYKINIIIHEKEKSLLSLLNSANVVFIRPQHLSKAGSVTSGRLHDFPSSEEQIILQKKFRFNGLR